MILKGDFFQQVEKIKTKLKFEILCPVDFTIIANPTGVSDDSAGLAVENTVM